MTGVRYADAGTSAVNGDYYEDDPYAGNPTWTKVGGVYLEDSIHYEPTLSKFIITSGGTFATATTNAKYDTPDDLVENTAPFATWYVRNGSSTPPGGGTLPAPGTLTPVEDLSYVIPEEVTPLRVLDCKTPCKFVKQPDTTFGLLDKRRKLASSLVFRGDDYTFFRRYERRASKRCEELTIRREHKCGNRWQTFWDGTMSAASGSWNLSKCEFVVRPEPKDRYSCLIREMDVKRNVLKVGPVTANIYETGAYEFAICIFGILESAECPEYQDDPFAPVTGWALVFSYGVASYNIAIYSRKVARTICIDGTPVPPTTGTWVLLTDNCAVDGTAIYVATGDLTAGDVSAPVNGVCVDGVPVAPADLECAGSVFNINGCGGTYTYYDGFADVDVDVPPLFVCLGGTPQTQDRCRKLYDVLRRMLDDSGCPIGEIQSDFFEWNAPGDTAGYSEGVNYVTGGENLMRQLLLVQKSDALDPGATNPAVVGEWTLKQLLTVLSVSMRVFWRIDADGNFRLEHYKGWTQSIGLDISTVDTFIEDPVYNYLKAENPRFEYLKMQDANGTDFVGADIQYSGPCVADDLSNPRKDYGADICTDVQNVLFPGNTASKDGFLMMASRFNGVDYDVINDIGALSLLPVTNAPLSAANLMRDFWTWDRPVHSGLMNGVETEFDGITPNTEQKGVMAQLCCEILSYDSNDRMTTRLGQHMGGVSAFVQSEEFDESTGVVYFTLRYER